ncbi:MAG: ABC transporter permease subunit [Wujia sp.]
MKERKIIAKILLVVVIVAGVIGIGSFVIKNKNDKEITFTVGFDAEFPPYGYKDENGEYVGFDLDLAEEVCRRNNWKLVKQPIDWDSKDMELDSGTIDCIWNGFTINGREEKYTWSKAYIDNSQVVIVRTDSDIQHLTDLADKVVVVQADSSALAAFKGEDATPENIALCESFDSLQQVSDYNSAFLNLEAGSVDAICMDIGVANYQIKQRGDKFRMLDENVSTERYGIGFKLGNTELRDEVQATLDEMLSDGTFEQIAEEWGLTDCICLDKEGTDEAYLQDAGKTEKGTFSEKFSNFFTHIGKVLVQLSDGMLASLAIFVLTLLFSMPLGLFICMMRRSRIKPVNILARIYISIMRGTPLMLQLLVVFFGPYYVFNKSLTISYRFYAVIIGFSLNYAAYFAEIYRAGIESIPVGQYEAAQLLSYSKYQTFWRIIFPQMVKRVIPPVTNEVITLIKDTSLAFVIAYAEMFTMAKQVAAADASIMPLFIAGVVYYVFNFLVAYLMEKLEKKMSYFS